MSEARLDMLERQMLVLRRQVHAIDERLDTVCSPPWKRLWWWVCGYRFYRVGRWYSKTADLN